MQIVFEQVLTGLSIGSILLLAALGLSIIYGTIGVINLAHGEFIMLGAYAAWALKTYAGVSLLPGLVLIFLGVGLFGWLVERILLRRLYQATARYHPGDLGYWRRVAASIRLTAGGDLRYVELPPSMAGSVSIMGVETSAYRIFIFVVAALLFLISWFIIYRTTFGLKAARGRAGPRRGVLLWHQCRPGLFGDFRLWHRAWPALPARSSRR